MSEPYVGEIRMFAGNFAPRGWSFCDGQLLAVSQHDALFSLLGTIYGGDGRTTFGLPDCRGRIPLHMGNGPGLSNRRQGSRGGEEHVTLTVNQIPRHNHFGEIQCNPDPATTSSPAQSVFAEAVGANAYHSGAGRGSAPGLMHPNALTHVGGSQSHTNQAPSLCINFIIAMVGVYPSRH